MATYTGTPRTWSAGETVTAALMNSDVRDPLAALAGAWSSWTTRVDQGASSNIAHTANYAGYIRVGKLVIAQARLTLSAAGTSGSNILAVLPVTAAQSSGVVGVGRIYDASGTTYYQALVQLNSTTGLNFVRQDTTATNGIGTDPSFALASSDTIQFAVVYEAA